MTPRPRVTPRPAMSARQVDRVEKQIKDLADDCEHARVWLSHVSAGLTRLLASVRRSERR